GLRPGGSDAGVAGVVGRGVEDLRAVGADLVDPFVIPDFDQYPARPHPHSEVRAAFERYLATTGPGFPKTVADVVATKKFHPLHEAGLLAALHAPAPADDPVVRELEAHEVRMRQAYLDAMQAAGIDAFIVPTASH